MAIGLKSRGAPVGIRVAVLLLTAYAVAGVLAVIGSFITHGVTGSSIFTGTPPDHVPSPRTMATLLSIFVIGELVWLGAPVVLGLAVIRGSNASRVAISAIATAGLLISIRWLASPLLLLPQALLVVAAVLLWIPSSNRYVHLERERSRRRKKETDALAWRSN